MHDEPSTSSMELWLWHHLAHTGFGLGQLPATQAGSSLASSHPTRPLSRCDYVTARPFPQSLTLPGSLPLPPLTQPACRLFDQGGTSACHCRCLGDTCLSASPGPGGSQPVCGQPSGWPLIPSHTVHPTGRTSLRPEAGLLSVNVRELTSEISVVHHCCTAFASASHLHSYRPPA